LKCVIKELREMLTPKEKMDDLKSEIEEYRMTNLDIKKLLKTA